MRLVTFKWEACNLSISIIDGKIFLVPSVANSFSLADISLRLHLKGKKYVTFTAKSFCGLPLAGCLTTYMFCVERETLNNVTQLSTSASNALPYSLKGVQPCENSNINSKPQLVFSRGTQKTAVWKPVFFYLLLTKSQFWKAS